MEDFHWTEQETTCIFCNSKNVFFIFGSKSKRYSWLSVSSKLYILWITIWNVHIFVSAGQKRLVLISFFVVSSFFFPVTPDCFWEWVSVYSINMYVCFHWMWSCLYSPDFLILPQLAESWTDFQVTRSLLIRWVVLSLIGKPRPFYLSKRCFLKQQQLWWGEPKCIICQASTNICFPVVQQVCRAEENSMVLLVGTRDLSEINSIFL